METMIVIAIVSLLLGVLLPVLFAARAKAFERVSAGNLRQLGTALQLYAQDVDGALPPYTNVESMLCFFNNPVGLIGPLPTDSDMPRLFRESVQPYVRANDVWFCPTDKVKGEERYFLGIRHKYTSYGYQPYGGPGLRAFVLLYGFPPPPLRPDDMPSWLPLLWEPGSAGDEGFNERGLSWEGREFRGYRSSGMALYLFPDLRVKSYPVDRKQKVGDDPESYW